MSGNKGAVGIRLDYYDTSFCFLTAHLAAGHSNVEERNADYRTIAHGLHFQKGKMIQSHELGVPYLYEALIINATSTGISSGLPILITVLIWIIPLSAR